MSLTDYPYRIVLNISNEDNADGRHYKWLFQTFGYGGTNKVQVQEALKEWYAEGNNKFDTSVENWTVKVTTHWRNIKMKFYFKEKKVAAMFKMIWGGIDE
jgi:hypothetical protein